ncbi:MAG: bile acid:sodium symporter family protein [Anaerolineales bacterium]|jgi:BASS family bile acid:Na+ symporter
MKKQFFANFPKIAQQYGRTLLLILAIFAGVSIPQAAVFSGSIQYLVFGMMFLSFVGLKFERSALRFSLLNVLVANIFVALVAFYLLRPVDDNLALVGFMTGISPTAISAPVVIALLERRVDYVVAAVLLTNLSMALIVPFLLPWLGGNQVHVSIWEVLQSVAVVVILPLILARLVRYLPQSAQKPLFRARSLTFILWVTALFLVMANASHFIYTNVTVPLTFLLQIAAIAIVLCVVNFSLGALLSGREFRRESSQVLGQKNLSFTIWLSLAFINPIVALGPTFYIICHHTYNSYQLYRFAKQKAGSHV